MKLKVNHIANLYEKYYRDLYLSFDQVMIPGFAKEVELAAGIRAIESKHVPPWEIWLAAGNQIGKTSRKYECIWIDEHFKEHEFMAVTGSVQERVAHLNDMRRYLISDASTDNGFLEAVNREVQGKMDAFAKQRDLYSDSHIFKPVQTSDENGTTITAVEVDRPTLAARLDKAEERIKELEGQLKEVRALRESAAESLVRVTKERENWKETARRAENIAAKYDAVCFDLEKCRVALGTVQFEKVVGAREPGAVQQALKVEDFDHRFR